MLTVLAVNLRLVAMHLPVDVLLFFDVQWWNA